MPESTYAVASNFMLSGGTLGGEIAVQSFSGLEMSVEVSANCAGNTSSGKRKLEPKPGPTKPGEPTFICPIPQGDTKLADWWARLNPNAQIGDYQTEDLTFTVQADGGGTHAEWQLKGVFPMKYQVSDADANSADLSSETIQLCVTEIQRMQ